MTDTEPSERVAARHHEPHDCTREGSWAACDFNRYVSLHSRDSEHPLAVMVSEDDVIHQIIRWATAGLLNDAVNTPIEQEAMEAIVSGRLRRRLTATSEAHRG